MRILITVPDLKLHGGVANIFNLLKLDKHSHIDYFVNTSGKKKSFFIPVMFLSFLLKVRKFELIHLNPSFNSKAIIRDGILLLLGKIMNCKVVVFIHGWDDKYEESLRRSKWKKFLFRKIYNKADGYILLGEIFKTKLQSLKIKSKNIFLLPTIADDTFIEDGFHRNFDFSKTLKLLFIARFDKQKGMDIAINALRMLNSLDSNLTFDLVMAGDGLEFDKWKTYVVDENIKNVKFAGYVSGIDKHRLFMESDILIFPSYYGEGLPCVIMEAMLYGLPVITRINGGISDWVKNGINGFITSSKNPDSFKDFIIELVKQPQLVKKISTNNIEVSRNNFVPSKIDEKLQYIYSYIMCIN